MNPPSIDNVNINVVQIFAIIGSISFFLFILSQIRSKRIREEYSLLWLFFGIIFIFISLWRDSLEVMARIVGVAYPPAALFLILIMAVFVILIQFSIIISRSTENNKHLTQEHSILKLEVESLKKELETLKRKQKESEIHKKEAIKTAQIE